MGGIAGSDHEVVGRDEELDAIDRFLNSDAPLPTALVLEGVAGIGKTTLWRHGVDLAERSGSRVHAITTSSSETQYTFAALGDLLRGALDDIDALPDPLRRALEVALLLSDPEDTPPDPRTIGVATLELLKLAASKNPLLLAIDDVQWLDPASASILLFVFRRLGSGPIRILLTQRIGEGDKIRAAVDRTFGEGLRRIRVDALSTGALHRILHSRLGLALPRRALRRLSDACEGRPFYALEIGALLKARGEPVDPAASLPVPSDMQELTRLRIKALPQRARDALLAAATAADPQVHLIERVGGSAGVEDAIAAGVLVSDGDRLRFSHPLVAEAIYTLATPGRRRDIHRRLAGAIDAADDEADERARHLGAAAEGVDAEIARELDAAASRVARRGAPADASELMDHAVRLTPDDNVADRLDRIARGAEYHLAAGDTGRGRSLLEQVVAAMPPGPDRSRALVRLGRILYVTDDVPASYGVLEKALLEADGDETVSAEAEQALALTAIFGGDLRGGLEHARSSLEIARRLDDPGLLGLALCRVAQTEFLCGMGFDRQSFERAVALEEHVAELPVEWQPSYAFAGAAMYADDLTTARGLYDGLHRAAEEQDDERSVPILLFLMTQLECAAGNIELALRYADEAVERSRQSGLGTLQANALSAQSVANALAGRPDAARAAAQEGLRIAGDAGAMPSFAWNTAALGFLELSLSDATAADGWLRPLSQMVAAQGLAEPAVLPFMPDAIEALIALGEADTAFPLLTELEERGVALDRAWARATAGRCRALFEAARGDLGAAAGSLKQALDHHARLERPFELGRTLLVQGTIERRAKHRRAARDALRNALVIFESLGTPLWAEKARAELARIGGRTANGGLTASEGRIAALVAQGKTNREVATDLFVSVHTVEAALTRVYGKLGVRSRTELANRLAETTKL